MRLLVCGSREWPGTREDIGVHLPEGRHVIIHGGCSRFKGGVQVSVDTLAAIEARSYGFDVDPYPVDKILDGAWPGAGPRRNARMLADGKPDKGLAFGALWRQQLNGTLFVDWKRTGTGDMVKRMLDAGLPVRWVAAPGADAVDLTEMPDPPR